MSDQTAGLILQAARVLFRPEDLVELRIPKAGRFRVISGYFDDLEKLSLSAALLEKQKYPGVYWTLNPVARDLLARSANRTKQYAAVLTSDPSIVTLRWLLVDLDPKRPAEISSTAAEKAAALSLAEQIREALKAQGWPEPVYADSGNGAHLLYRIDLPNEQGSEDVLKAVLQSLAARFDTPEVSVDKTTFNPSRISKIYGTTARKGDSIPERPHRLSRLLHVPGDLTPVSLDLLRQLAAQAPQPAPPQRTQARAYSQQRYTGPAHFDLRGFLDRHGVRYRAPVAYEGGYKYVLEECPFDGSHKAPDSAVFERPDGYGFKCLHNSCHGRAWREFRALFEPDAYTPRPPRADRPPEPPPWPEEPAELRRRADGATVPQPQEDAVELSVNPADVQAAIDVALGRNDMVAPMLLVPEIIKLRLIDQAVIKAKLKQHFDGKFPLRDYERAILEAAGDNPGQKPPGRPPEANSGGIGPDLIGYPLTDAGNGERIVAMFGSEIRYCVEMAKWLVWDGKRWAVDERNFIRQKAKQMARLLYAQSVGALSAIEKHARKSESYAAISAALGCAATEPGIPISAAELDKQPLLLNCLNGVLDLESGKLLLHRKEYLITKLCPVAYDPKAQCARFLEFLHWAMGATNPEAELTDKTVRLVAFLQRGFGYSLTSDVSESAVFVCHGGGKNGKSTLLTLFRDLLGADYSGQIVIDTVMSMKNQDATTRADLADLRGVRFVMTSEVEKEHKLSEGKIKYITAGMGNIKSCRKYENPIEFKAAHKLWMDCNHKPVVRGVDEGIWRRLKLIPFIAVVKEEERDLHLIEKLREELPGILAWAVRGCLEWQKQRALRAGSGLGDPPEIVEAGQFWREHDDPLKEFLEDCCETGPELFARVNDLAAGYAWWARENREKFPMGRESFNERLESKGYKQSRGRRVDGKQARCWEGIELKTDVAAAIRHRDSGQPWMPE